MPSRRTFLSLLAGGTVARHLAFAQGPPRPLALYGNVGPVLMHYDVDLANAELIKRDSVTLPAGVQYCWPHRNRRYFYVASSSGAAGTVQIGAAHHVTAFRIDPTGRNQECQEMNPECSYRSQRLRVPGYSPRRGFGR